MDLVNDSMTRSSNHDNLYGLTGVGKWHVNTFMDATHINDREKSNTLIYQSVAAGGPNQYKFDFRILYPDKSIHWLNVIGEVIERDAQGVGTKLRGFLTDITDRKEAEEALKNYTKRLSNLNNLNSGILAAITVKEISANAFQFLEEVVDYKFATLSQIDVTNKTYTRVAMHNKASLKEFYFDHKPVPFSKLDLIDYEMLASGKPQFCNDIKTIKVTSDNHKKLLQENINSFLAVPLITEDNLVGGLAVFCENDQVFTDKNIEIVQELANQLAIAINQKKLRDEIIQHTLELEVKVAERTAQLEYTNNELRDFAQVVSHDLKAPLRAISQLSFWLSKDYADKLDEAGQNQLSLIISRTKRLDDLIEGILQYSRAGKSLEKEVEINFNTVVKNCIIALNPPKHIKITIDNKLPNYKADETRMAQLFQNLINNAIKYNNKPIGAIHIGCKTKKGFYEFYVSDNGIGIEEQYFERIFQIFQRLESRDVQEGTGIGLSLVKRIVQIYGGEVNLTSKIGEGSTFFFTLPIINEID